LPAHLVVEPDEGFEDDLATRTLDHFENAGIELFAVLEQADAVAVSPDRFHRLAPPKRNTRDRAARGRGSGERTGRRQTPLLIRANRENKSERSSKTAIGAGPQKAPRNGRRASLKQSPCRAGPGKHHYRSGRPA